MAPFRHAPRTFLRPNPARPTIRPTPFLSRRTYASQQSSDEGSGVVKKLDPEAKPKILEHVPPPSESASEEVRKHNESFEDRPDRASNKIDDKGRPVTGQTPPEGTTSSDKVQRLRLFSIG